MQSKKERRKGAIARFEINLKTYRDGKLPHGVKRFKNNIDKKMKACQANIINTKANL